ncbi:MAG: hypothetical protein J2O47_02015, partial [Acidimicrobiaceae bacterium]|nr:hypothetical protein [Acidimicrobiaceae bacterium]
MPIEPGRWRCSCGEPLDLSPLPPGPVRLDRSLRSLWRYRRALAFEATETAWRSISLREGGTPLIAEPPRGVPGHPGHRSDAHQDWHGVYLKLDFLMP